MSKKKRKNKTKNQNNIQQAPAKKEISRRKSLYIIGGSILAAGAAILLGPRLLHRNPDYIFFPELHQTTPVETAVQYALNNGTKRVALEGLPQGKVDSSIYPLYADQYDIYRQDVDAFDKQIVGIEEQENSKGLIQKLLDNKVFTPFAVIAVQNGMHTLASALLNAYSYNHENKIVGNQFRYCKAFMDKKIEVHGVEDPNLYKKTVKEIYVQDSVNKFYQTITQLKALFAKADSLSKTSEDKELVQKLSGISDKLDNIMRGKGLRRSDVPYGDDLTSKMQKEREASVRQRSEIWLEYIRPLTSIMLIYGKAHTPVNVEIARRQGKTYKVAEEGLVR